MVLTLSIFVRQKSFYSKKEPKSASRRLNKLKQRVLKNFLDGILNYRSAGPGPKKLVPHISTWVRDEYITNTLKPTDPQKHL